MPERISGRQEGNPDRVLTGDAGEILKELTGTYDLIFMDAAKGQYINWLPDVLQLMHKGSVLVLGYRSSGRIYRT